MKNVLIAGAGGYIGSRLYSLLREFPDEYRLSTLSLRRKMPAEDMLSHCDVLIFAVGLAHVKESPENREDFFEINCNKAVSLAAAAKRAGAGQFIYMSSMSVYGLLSGDIDARAEEKPRTAYGASKLKAERELKALESEDFAVSIIRAPMVYGPGCPGNYRRLRELALKISVFPKIENRRSMIYIGNLCAFIKKITDEGRGGTFIPRNSEYVCSSELVRAIARENGRRIRLIPFPASLPGLKRLPVFQKVFGSLSCSGSVPVDEFPFALSVSLTERDWGRLPPAPESHPQVSVVIPSYNSAGYLGAALDSALMQEGEPEIIVVDDASTDNTPELMEAYRAEPRVKYIRNEKNLGAAASRRRGVEEAAGAYIAFLDADDIWAEGKLKRQLRLLEETGYVLCSTARELMDSSGRPTGAVHPVKAEFDYRQLLKENFISCSSVLIRAEAAREFPMSGDEVHEDYVCWLSVLKKYGRGCGINEPLIRYRVSSCGKSGSKLHSSLLTYRSYRMHGFGPAGACLHLLIFTAHTFSRYAGAFIRRNKKTAHS